MRESSSKTLVPALVAEDTGTTLVRLIARIVVITLGHHGGAVRLIARVVIVTLGQPIHAPFVSAVS